MKHWTPLLLAAPFCLPGLGLTLPAGDPTPPDFERQLESELGTTPKFVVGDTVGHDTKGGEHSHEYLWITDELTSGSRQILRLEYCLLDQHLHLEIRGYAASGHERSLPGLADEGAYFLVADGRLLSDSDRAPLASLLSGPTPGQAPFVLEEMVKWEMTLPFLFRLGEGAELGIVRVPEKGTDLDPRRMEADAFEALLTLTLEADEIEALRWFLVNHVPGGRYAYRVLVEEADDAKA